MGTLAGTKQARPRRTHLWLCALVTLVCAFACALSMTSTAQAITLNPTYEWYTAHTGTIADPYTITTRNEFAGFTELVNGTADTDGDGVADTADTFANKTVELGASINFMYANLTPAGGANDRVFEGVFDGAGYTLSAFKIVPADGQTENIGLIGEAGEDSIIKNVTVGSNASLTIDQTGVEKLLSNIALVVGKSEGTLVNCTNNGDVTVSSDAAMSKDVIVRICNVGGVAGQCLGDITSCENTGNVAVAETWEVPDGVTITDAEAVVYVGGVVGCAGDMDKSIFPDSGEACGIIKNCVNSGTISCDTPSEVGASVYSTSYLTGRCIGGVAGYSRGSVEYCTNSGYVNSEHGQDLGGVVGGLRSAIPTDAYNGGSSESDEGTADTQIHILGCQNTGCVAAYVSVGGVAGRLGSYTEAIGCINGDPDVTTLSKQNWVAATRPNKPCPGGIVGVSYSDIDFCANYGNVASCWWDFENMEVDTDGSTCETESDKETCIKFKGLKSGYYATGICAMLWHFSNDGGVATSPLPTVYSCVNFGQVQAIDNMRQRNIAGDAEEGYVNDNFAVTGLCYNDAMTYENAIGVNLDMTASRLMANDTIKATDTSHVDESGEAVAVPANVVGKTPVEVMNAHASSNGWTVYWNASDGSSYPSLNLFGGEGTQDLSSGVATQKTEAPYTGVAGSTPTFTVKLGTKTLVQGVDFRVIPEEDAVEMTSGATPYTATLEGIGQYTGTITGSYGIGALDLSACTVTINSVEFDYQPHAPSADDITVKNAAGAIVDPDNYTFAFGDESTEWADSAAVDGKPVNAGSYDVVVSAKEGVDSVKGSVSGKFVISKTSLIYSIDDRKEKPEKFAESAHATVVNEGTAYEAAWQSFRALASSGTSTSGEKEEIATTFPYTGHVIMPEVTVGYKGKTLGVYYNNDGAYTHLTLGDFAADDYSNQLKAVIGGNELEGEGVVYDNIGSATEKTVGGVLIRARMGENSLYANYVSYDAMKFYIDPSIKANLADASVSTQFETYAYAGGEPVEPDVTVIVLGSQLDLGTDYTVTYHNNTEVGTATYTITAGANGIFEGSYTGTFKIAEVDPYEISYDYDDDDLTATATGLTYFGATETFDLTIPSTVAHDGKTYTVTAIGASAFKANSAATNDAAKIASVTIPWTVETIGAAAFGADSDQNTRVLSSVKFDDVEKSKLTTIGMNAFRGCNQLTEFTFPENVDIIGKYAFDMSQKANKLTKLTFMTKSATLPSSVATIGTFNNVGKFANVEVYAYASATAVQRLITNNSGTTAGTNKGMRFTLAGEPGQPVEELVATASTKTVELGQTASLTCAVAGAGTSTLTYQWQRRASSADAWQSATEAGAATATLSAKATATLGDAQYRCVVTASDGRTAETAPISFDVTIPDLVATASTEQVAFGETGSLECSVEGAAGSTLSYLWQYSSNGGTTWKTATATGYNTDTLTAKVTTTRMGNIYKCCVTASDGRTAETDAIAFDVKFDKLSAKASTEPVALGETGSLICEVEGEGAATLKYQWMYSTDEGATWKKATASGNTTDTLTAKVTAARASYLYKCCVTASDGRTAETDAIAFDASGVALSATASTLPVALTETGKLTCTVEGLGDATATYQWQYRSSSTGSWQAATATGAKTATLTAKVTATRARLEYRCVVTSSDNRTATTDPIAFDVVDELTATAYTTPAALNTTAKLYCAVAGVGSSSVSSWQWQYRTSDTAEWKNATATGNKTSVLTAKLTEARASYQYRCVIVTADDRTAATDPIAFQVG